MLTVAIPSPRHVSPPKPRESALLRARRSRAKRVAVAFDAKEGDLPLSGLPQDALDKLSVTSLLFDEESMSSCCSSASGLSQTTLDSLSVPGRFFQTATGSDASCALSSPDTLGNAGGLPQDLLDALCIF